MKNGKPFVVTELWAYIGVADDGDEGIMACSMPLRGDGSETMVPMVAADRQRFESLKPFANMVSKATNTPYVVKRFRLIE